MLKTIENKLVQKHITSKKLIPAAKSSILHPLALNNSLLAHVISTVSKGQILIANKAACKLLGYTKKELLTKSRSAIFDVNESGFKKIVKQKTAAEQSASFVKAIRKNGKSIPVEITSAVFIDDDGIKKSITIITDISQRVQQQKNIDNKKEKVVADNIAIAISKQKVIDIKMEKIVADNISVAKSKQKVIDIKKEKTVADNIAAVKSKQKVIDIKKEKIVAYNIAAAKSKQKVIDIKKEKIVADNIKLALEKGVDEKMNFETAATEILLLEEKLELEIKLKEKQIEEATKEAKESERSDLGKELHDNINQLLGASRMYLEMAKHGGEQSGFYLSRSSEYTLKAIEEIRKLTKGLTTDMIKNHGLSEAIDNMSRDTMEVNPVKISYAAKGFIETSVNDKFKLNLFRIVQEQLNNILKHAKATEVIIHLSQNKKSIILSLSDNGVGFDTGKKQKGIGVANIKSRATSYKGTADFVSRTGQGCVLTVNFPLSNSLPTGAALSL